MEQFTQPVEGRTMVRETAAIHGGLQVPGWAVGVQGLRCYFDFPNHGWVDEGTSCLNGYFFPKPPVKPDVIVSHHPAFSVLPR